MSSIRHSQLVIRTLGQHWFFFQINIKMSPSSWCSMLCRYGDHILPHLFFFFAAFSMSVKFSIFCFNLPALHSVCIIHWWSHNKGEMYYVFENSLSFVAKFKLVTVTILLLHLSSIPPVFRFSFSFLLSHGPQKLPFTNFCDRLCCLQFQRQSI